MTASDCPVDRAHSTEKSADGRRVDPVAVGPRSSVGGWTRTSRWMSCCASSTRRCGGWCAYFRAGMSARTFSYLSSYLWGRVIGWRRRKHRRTTWKELCRRYCGGRWWPCGPELRMFNPPRCAPRATGTGVSPTSPHPGPSTPHRATGLVESPVRLDGSSGAAPLGYGLRVTVIASASPAGLRGRLGNQARHVQGEGISVVAQLAAEDPFDLAKPVDPSGSRTLP